MRRIAVVNHKGGTGKTTTAVHLAAGLATAGRSVLLADLDPQGNVGAWFGLDPDECSMAEMAQGRLTAAEALIEVRENLDVIASDWRLAEAEELLVTSREREKWLTNRLKGLKGYEFAIVDCAPSMSILTTSGLAFAEEVVIPISMEYLALIGVKQLVENILRMTSKNGKAVRITAVVPTFYQTNLRKSREILLALERHFGRALADPIRVNVRLSEAPSHGQTVFEYSPRSRGAQDYRRLVRRFASA
jgi:chromosome partitioning protein